MAGRAVQCGNCSNANMEYLSFSPDGQYVICSVCGTSTRLYDSYIIQEHTGEVRIAGFRTLGDRLENGNTLLRLRKFADAEAEFRSLSKEYAFSYETWFGLARSVSQDFSSLDRWEETIECLEAADAAAQRERKNNSKINAARKYFIRLQESRDRLDAAKQRVSECENNYRGTLSSADGTSLNMKRHELERYKKGLPKPLGIICTMILIILIGAVILCFNGAAKSVEATVSLAEGLYEKGFSNEEIEAYIYQKTDYIKFVEGYSAGRIVSVIALLVYTPFFLNRLRDGVKHVKYKEKIGRLHREINQLEPLVAAGVQESERMLNAAKQEAALREQEMTQIKNSYTEAYEQWL